MRIVGSISPDQVPPHVPLKPVPRGVWQSVAARVLHDHKRGMVTVVDVADETELSVVRKGVFDALRRHNAVLQWSTNVTARNELRLYLSVDNHKEGS